VWSDARLKVESPRRVAALARAARAEGERRSSAEAEAAA